MDILFLLIPLSLVLVALVVWALLWAVRSGQFEDLEGPAHRILMDDDAPRLDEPDRDESADESSSGKPSSGEPSIGDAELGGSSRREPRGSDRGPPPRG